MATRFHSSTFAGSPSRGAGGSPAVEKARHSVDGPMNTVIDGARAAGLTQRIAVEAITDRALKRSVTSRSEK